MGAKVALPADTAAAPGTMAGWIGRAALVGQAVGCGMSKILPGRYAVPAQVAAAAGAAVMAAVEAGTVAVRGTFLPIGPSS
jgi:hypothetical protein